jgi:hypothetical protein
MIHTFITTYMLQFHNIPDIINQTPDQFPPTHIHNQKEEKTFNLPTMTVRCGQIALLQ